MPAFIDILHTLPHGKENRALIEAIEAGYNILCEGGKIYRTQDDELIQIDPNWSDLEFRQLIDRNEIPRGRTKDGAKKAFKRYCDRCRRNGAPLPRRPECIGGEIVRPERIITAADYDEYKRTGEVPEWMLQKYGTRRKAVKKLSTWKSARNRMARRMDGEKVNNVGGNGTVYGISDKDAKAVIAALRERHSDDSFYAPTKAEVKRVIQELGIRPVARGKFMPSAEELQAMLDPGATVPGFARDRQYAIQYQLRQNGLIPDGEPGESTYRTDDIAAPAVSRRHRRVNKFDYATDHADRRRKYSGTR